MHVISGESNEEFKVTLTYMSKSGAKLTRKSCSDKFFFKQFSSAI